MYISARERQILELIISNLDGITVKTIADQLEVSERTIHRDLKGIENILAEYHLSLKKQSGVGIKMVGEEERIREIELFLFNSSHAEYTPEERHTLILCTLLEEKEPVKLATLALDLNVTVATISNDLNKLEEWLTALDLVLIRRRGYGVEVEGTERAKREAMSSLIVKNYNEAEFLTVIRDSIQRKLTHQMKTSTERLLGFVEKEKLVIVEKAIEEVNEDLPYPIADSSYIGLVVHLALAIERILQGEKIEMDAQYLEGIQETKEYEAAEKISSKLTKVFQIQIPKAEIGYITMHLRGAKLRYDKEFLLEENTLQIAQLLKQLIVFVSEKTGQDLTQDSSLFQGMLAHLKPAIYRIKQNMRIHNPLLEKIKKDYIELFEIIRQGMDKIFAPLIVPDAEIGYLVMHFGSVVEKDHFRKDVRALVICSSGIGSSKLLSSRMKKRIPEIKYLQNASLFELEEIDLDSFDIIVSTVPITNLEKEYILVQPFLTEGEVAEIYDFIRKDGKTTNETARPSSTVKESDQLRPGDSIPSFRAIGDYSRAIETVLEGFQYTHFDNKNIQDALTEACFQLYKKGTVAHPTRVVDALLTREKLGGIGIPNTSLALFHTRSEDILQISFSIYSLNEPEERKAMDDYYIRVENILLLLAPENPSEQELELLSFISSLIIESEATVDLFQSQDEERVAVFLRNSFERFFGQKLADIRRDRDV
jgi:mannitol operon transcriptional antiterminator